MKSFESRLKELTIPVRAWCLVCPDFKDMLVHAERYGTTPDGVAALAIRQCSKAPIEHPSHHPDGTPLEYWETKQPTCKLGESKQIADAEIYVREHGLNVVRFVPKKD